MEVMRSGILIGIQNPSCVPFPHGVVAVVLNRVFVQNHYGGHEQTYFRREASEHLPCWKWLKKQGDKGYEKYICLFGPNCLCKIQEPSFTHETLSALSADVIYLCPIWNVKEGGHILTFNLEVLWFYFFVDPNSEPESHREEPELESHESRSKLDPNPHLDPNPSLNLDPTST